MEGKYFIIPYYQILHSFNGFIIKNSKEIIILYGYFTFVCNKNVGHVIRKTHFTLHFPSLQKTRCLFKYSYLSQNCFRTKRNVVVIHGIRLDDNHYKHFLLISNVNFIQKFMVMITNDRCIITHSFCFFPKNNSTLNHAHLAYKRKWSSVSSLFNDCNLMP